MLLSRHFWVGLGVGFALAGLFVFQTASAFYTSNLDQTWSQWGNTQNAYSFSSTTPTEVGLGLVKSTTAYCSNCISARFGILPDTYDNLGITDISIDYSLVVNSGTCTAQYAYRKSASVVFAVTAISTSTSVMATTTTFNVTSNGFGAYDAFGIVTRAGTGSYTVNCLVTVTRIYDQAGNDYLEFYDSSASGGGATSTVFYPLGLNAMIDDMNCVNSATGTDCSFIYSSLTPFTLQNIVLLTVLFLLFGFIGYWLIKTFW